MDRPERTLVVRQGTTGELWARANLKAAKVLSVEKENSAVLEVIQGKADAFHLRSNERLAELEEESGDNARHPYALTEGALGGGVRKDNDELRLKINDFLKDFRDRGGFQKLGDEFLREQKEAFRKENIPFYF